MQTLGSPTEVQLVGDHPEVAEVPSEVDPANNSDSDIADLLISILDTVGSSWSAAEMDPSARPMAIVTASTAVVLALAVAACSSDDNTDSSREGTTTTAAPSAAPAEPDCEEGMLGERPYILCTAAATPDEGLVVALHGRGSSAAEMQAVTELDRSAAPAGLAVVYPESLDGGWGDDTFATPTRPAGDEDLVFLDNLVETLRADPRIVDDEPVGLVGFSNGASMALRYGAQRPDDVGAVVSVAGQLPRDPAVHPSVQVPLLELYGTADPLRPYDTGIADTPGRQPGQPTPTLSTPDTVAAFVVASPGSAPEHEGPVESDRDPADGTSVRTERWTDAGRTLAVLRAVVGGGHTRPSAHAPFAAGAGFGPVSQDIDASAEAITFLVDPDDLE